MDISMCVNVSVDHAFVLSSPTTPSANPFRTRTLKFITRTSNTSSHSMSPLSLDTLAADWY